MAFRPLHDRVVVQALDSESKTAGGIIIPDTAKEKPSQGKVISVGPGARDNDGKIVPIDLKKGDTVLYGKYSGTEVKIDGKVSVGEISTDLSKKFNAPKEVIMKDVIEMLQELSDKGFIEE